MGQGFGSGSNINLKDWQQNPFQKNVYINCKSGEEVQCHTMMLDKQHEAFIRKRVNQNHNYIAKILYLEPTQKNSKFQDQMQFYIFTQKLQPACPEEWIPCSSTLSLLKGLRRLCSSYRPFLVTNNLIKMNKRKEIRVWVNQSITSNQVEQYCQTEQEMLVSVSKIVMDLDRQIGYKLENCHTFNDCINSILHNLKDESFFNVKISSKINKIQDPKKYLTNFPINNKNKFRTTKQTEDTDVKPLEFSDLSREKIKMQLNQKKQRNIKNITRNPTTTNIYKSNQPEDPMPRKSANLSKSKKKYFVNSSHGNQQSHFIQTSSHMNISQPEKHVFPNKPHHFSNNYSTHNVEKSNNLLSSKSKTEKQTDLFKEMLHKPYFSKNVRSESNNKFGQTFNQVKNETLQEPQSFRKEKSQVNTYRENQNKISESKLLASNKTLALVPEVHRNDPTRIKTQQFYVHNSQGSTGIFPRFKTNYLLTNSSKQVQLQTPQNQKYINRHSNSKTKSKSSNMELLSFNGNLKEPIKQKNQEETKMKKMKQIQKIKQEMSCLGIKHQESVHNLKQDKSTKDLVRKKIEQKSKKHEQLKSAISKLLKQ